MGENEEKWSELSRACLKRSRDLLPEPCSDWLQAGAVEAFPECNGHNKVFYGYKALFVQQVQAFIEERAELITQLFKDYDPSVLGLPVKFTKNFKCVNCNKAFCGKDGTRLRWAAIVMPCKYVAQVISIDRCVQCKVIQWLMEGAIRGKLREKPHWPPLEKWNHPGYAPCSHCYRQDCTNNWCLQDIYKVSVDESPPVKIKKTNGP